MVNKKIIKAAAALAFITCLSHTFAADFPEKGRRITLLVPYGAGGQVDLMARAMAPIWDQKWGTQTIVFNKVGAGGQVALNELLRQPKDGYTIAFTQGFETQLSYLNTEGAASYSRSSFTPVALTQHTPGVWIVKSDSPYGSMKDLLNDAKNNPGKINFGSTSPRSPASIYVDGIENKFGAKLNLVAFNDGPSMMNALMGGHVDLGLINATVALPFINSGKIKALMVSGEKPVKYFPGVPTSQSVGVDVTSYGSTTGLTLAAGTPASIVSRWSEMIKEVIGNQDLKSKMDSMALNLEYASPDEYSNLWRAAEQEATKYLMKVNGKVRPIN